MNASLSTGMPTMHYIAEPLVPTEDLSNMSVEELQAELIRTRQAFHSAGDFFMSYQNFKYAVQTSHRNVSTLGMLSHMPYMFNSFGKSARAQRV